MRQYQRFKPESVGHAWKLNRQAFCDQVYHGTLKALILTLSAVGTSAFALLMCRKKKKNPTGYLWWIIYQQHGEYIYSSAVESGTLIDVNFSQQRLRHEFHLHAIKALVLIVSASYTETCVVDLVTCNQLVTCVIVNLATFFCKERLFSLLSEWRLQSLEWSVLCCAVS